MEVASECAVVTVRAPGIHSAWVRCFRLWLKNTIHGSELADRVAATQITTAPPGIPVLMPGERAG
ncbi:MAG: hypothetical protein ACRDOO_13415, partial [Actinomadura sp.]